MARKPQFTDAEILAAGERLVRAGEDVSRASLRRAVGGGNPARLWEVWEAGRPALAGARPAAPERLPRKRNPAATRREVLQAAIAEFAEKGLSGARVDAIAARTRTTKRSIYYHFGSKEGLYTAVLESVYGAIRSVERESGFVTLPPVEAMRRLVEFTFDYHNDHPELNRLVMNENIHHAEHLKKSLNIRSLNVSAIDNIRLILERGRQEGVFRRQVDPVDLHMMMSAFCFFRMSNRYTLSTIFGVDLTAAEVRGKHKAMLADMILSFLAQPEQQAEAVSEAAPALPAASMPAAPMPSPARRRRAGS